MFTYTSSGQAAQPRFKPTLASVECRAEAMRPGGGGWEAHLQGEAGQASVHPSRRPATWCPLPALGPGCTSSEVSTLRTRPSTFPLPPGMPQGSHSLRSHSSELSCNPFLALPVSLSSVQVGWGGGASEAWSSGSPAFQASWMSWLLTRAGGLVQASVAPLIHSPLFSLPFFFPPTAQ